MAVIGNSLAPYFTAVSTDVFSANGTGNTFSLSRNISNLGDIEVVVNNIQQNPYSGSYSVSGNTLTFSEAPLSGSNNVVVTYRQATLGSTIPTPNTVGNSSLQSNLLLTGNTTLGNTSIVGTLAANATTITGTLTSNAHTMTGNLSVTGNTTLTGALTVIGNNVIIANTITIDSNNNNGNTVTITSANNNFNIPFGSTQDQYTNLILKTNSGTAQIWRGGSSYSSYAGNSGLSIYCSNSTGGHIGLFSGGDGTASVMAYANGCVRFPRQPMFNVTPNNNAYIQTSPIAFNSDAGYGVLNANFNTSTYRFTAPISGNYYFSLQIYTRLEVGTDQYVYPRYRINGTLRAYTFWQRFGAQTSQQHQTIHLNTLYGLTAGDYIDVQFNCSANGYYYSGEAETRWSGWLVG